MIEISCCKKPTFVLYVSVFHFDCFTVKKRKHWILINQGSVNHPVIKETLLKNRIYNLIELIDYISNWFMQPLFSFVVVKRIINQKNYDEKVISRLLMTQDHKSVVFCKIDLSFVDSTYIFYLIKYTNLTNCKM